MKLYENVFTAKNTLYTREYDSETRLSKIRAVSFVPDLYIPTKELSKFKSIITKGNLKRLTFSSFKEYNDEIKRYKEVGIRTYGLKSREHNFIRETYGDPVSNDHPFRTMYLDIETAILDDKTPKNITRNDWKPEGERAAMAVITSIQMFDTKSKKFFILGLAKDWENKNNFKSPHGEIKYIKCNTEEDLLKKFLTILSKINPTVIAGWNSEGYDYPYITMRIMRVLDGINDIFIYDNNGNLVFNRQALSEGYVSQLSPVGLIKYKAQETTYGTQHTFQWVGYILEDYKLLYQKYTYTTLTS